MSSALKADIIYFVHFFFNIYYYKNDLLENWLVLNQFEDDIRK